MRFSTLSFVALAGSGVAQLVVPFGASWSAFNAAREKAVGQRQQLGAQSQQPLSGSKHGKYKSSSADLPGYKHGQYTLTPQDGSVCPSYGEKQWTGTIDVTNTRRLFFWAFESRNDPANDPVIVWMNGGPGSSSMTGAFTEMGACMLWNDTDVPVPNPWSWNNNATVVFLDQPAGVGFSTVAEGAKAPGKDADGAEDFQEFLNILFRDVFPEKAKLPIHITAESYGGHYGPTYLHHILESRRYNAPNAFWGNITSLVLIDAVLGFGGPILGTYELLCHDERAKGIMTEEQCEEMLTHVPEVERLWRACEQSMEMAVCQSLSVKAENITRYYDALVEKGERNPHHILRTCVDYPICPNTEMGDYVAYLNRPEVKKALKFPEPFQFEMINYDINFEYNDSGSVYISTSPKVGDILDAYKTPKIVDDGKSIGDVRVMVLNGNLDNSLNSHGNILQYDHLIWSRLGEYRAAKWRDIADEDVAGTGSWKGTKDGRLVFMAVDDAGHMVPGDVPEASYRIMQRWMHGGWK